MDFRYSLMTTNPSQEKGKISKMIEANISLEDWPMELKVLQMALKMELLASLLNLPKELKKQVFQDFYLEL